jgi:5-methylcytosine-specific restriction endonuclease McrA
MNNQYRDYLNSPQWQEKRSELFRLKGYKCVECGSTRRVQAHHVSYRNIFHENVATDLIPLCIVCHYKLHDLQRAVKHRPILEPRRKGRKKRNRRSSLQKAKRQLRANAKLFWKPKRPKMHRY